MEEAARTFGAFGIADKELDVHVADDLDVPLVQFPIHPLEPRPLLVDPLHGEVCGISLAMGRVGKAPEVRPVEAKLRDLGLGLGDERQILRIAVGVPVGDHPRELEPRPLGGERVDGRELQQSEEKDQADPTLAARHDGSPCPISIFLSLIFLSGIRPSRGDAILGRPDRKMGDRKMKRLSK